MRNITKRLQCTTAAAVLTVGLATLFLTSPASAQRYLFGRADFATGKNPVFVVTGDLNGDGRPDLVVPNRDDATVSVLLGKSDGTFAAKVDYGTGGEPFSVTLGDFNGDRKLDLAVADSSDRTISIL